MKSIAEAKTKPKAEKIPKAVKLPIVFPVQFGARLAGSNPKIPNKEKMEVKKEPTRKA